MKPLATLTGGWTIAVFALLLPISSAVAAQTCLQGASFSQEKLMDTREVQIASYKLFLASHCGSDQIERAMWVTFRDGEFGFVRWPSSGKTNTEFWKGPLPECTVANIHTHPTKRPERPSFTDHELADGHQLPSIRLPVYVLHSNGIWKAVPGSSRPVNIRESNWVREFLPQIARAKTR